VTTKKKAAGAAIAEEFIAGFKSLVATAKAGGLEAVKRKHTIRSVPSKKFELPPVTVRGIIEVRDSLGVSQPIFAKILGVSPQSVKAWEQGSKSPPGTVRRLIDEMKRNPGYWRERFALESNAKYS